MIRLAALFAAIGIALGLGPVAAQGDGRVSFPIGYVELEEDHRYVGGSAHAGIVFRTLGRPFPGAEVGLADAEAVGRIVAIEFALLHARPETVDELVGVVSEWVERGVNFVLADLPADELIRLAEGVADHPVLLLNVSAPDDALRGADCRANVAHVYPSRAMLTDALVQHLVAKNWTRILLLEGEAASDAATAEAMRRSAAKFGARIVAERPFALTNDPRRRGESNVALMTGGVDVDVVSVADESHEFARYVPYQTMQPQPVVGAAGLMPQAWHWSWDRHGAPQLQHRFEALAMPRRMSGEAWAAWAAMKAVAQVAVRSDPGEFAAMRDFMLGETFRLDGAKGNPMNFRHWNQQLRQPILLVTADAVIARAPLEPFLHRTNDLDTLGADAPESACRFE